MSEQLREAIEQSVKFGFATKNDTAFKLENQTRGIQEHALLMGARLVELWGDTNTSANVVGSIWKYASWRTADRFSKKSGREIIAALDEMDPRVIAINDLGPTRPGKLPRLMRRSTGLQNGDAGFFVNSEALTWKESDRTKYKLTYQTPDRNYAIAEFNAQEIAASLQPTAEVKPNYVIETDRDGKTRVMATVCLSRLGGPKYFLTLDEPNIEMVQGRAAALGSFPKK